MAPVLLPFLLVEEPPTICQKHTPSLFPPHCAVFPASCASSYEGRSPPPRDRNWCFRRPSNEKRVSMTFSPTFSHPIASLPIAPLRDSPASPFCACDEGPGETSPSPSVLWKNWRRTPPPFCLHWKDSSHVVGKWAAKSPFFSFLPVRSSLLPQWHIIHKDVPPFGIGHGLPVLLPFEEEVRNPSISCLF